MRLIAAFLLVIFCAAQRVAIVDQVVNVKESEAEVEVANDMQSDGGQSHRVACD